MEINRGQLTRRGLFIATGSALLETACKPIDYSWETMQIAQGEIVKKNLAEVGIINEGWQRLIPSNQLPPELRKEYGLDPTSKYATLQNYRNCLQAVTFMFQTEPSKSNPTPKSLKVSFPLTIPIYVINTDSGEDTQVSFTFDLSKFIRYEIIPNRGSLFRTDKQADPNFYLTTPGAIKNIRFSGPAGTFDSLTPLADVVTITASSQK